MDKQLDESIEPAAAPHTIFYAKDSFEVRDAGNKGVGVYATRDIPAGTQLFSERAILSVPGPLGTTKISDLVKVARILFLKVGSDVVVQLSLRTLANRWTPLYQHDELSQEDKDRYAKLRTIADMPNRSHDLADFARHRGLPISDPGFQLYMKFNSNTKGYHKDDVVRLGVYDLACRFNHSCRPNPGMEPAGKDTIRYNCFTIKDVSKGEEITNCYALSFDLMTQAERRKSFPFMGYSWDCECQVCTSSLSDRLLSDMRRCLLRHLKIAITGRDSSAPFKLDEARIQREMFDHTKAWAPYVRTTVFNALFAMIADPEGVMYRPAGYEAYMYAAISLYPRTKELGLKTVPKPALQNMRAWVKRSKELAALDGVGVSSEWEGYLKHIEPVTVDGKLGCTCEDCC